MSALQLCWCNWQALCDNVFGGALGAHNPGEFSEHYSDTCGEVAPFITCFLPTISGLEQVLHGDWIMRAGSGRFHIIKPNAPQLQSLVAQHRSGLHLHVKE